MNQYASSLRSFRARNLFETTITPPNDLTVAYASCKRQVLNRYQPLVNIQSNLLVKRLGVFSNFADGLVFKNNAFPLGVTLSVAAYTRTLLAASFFNIAAGSKAVAGSGFTGLTNNTILMLAVHGSAPSWQYFILDGDPASDNAMTFTDYSDTTGNDPGLMYKLTVVPGSAFFYYSWISELNYMYEIDKFLTPLAYGSAGMTDLVIQVFLNQGLGRDYYDSHDTTFLTKSVDTAFAASAVHFDVVADLEYTPA